MITPAQIANLCTWLRGEVGVTEATGHNDGARVEWYIALGTKAAREPGLSWCAALAITAYREQGIDIAGNDWLLRRVSTMYEVARKHGAILGEDEMPAPGDWLVWLGRNAHKSAGPSGHVETVVGAVARGVLECVGGNVGNSVALTHHLTDDSRITAIVRPARMVEADK